MVGGPIVRKGSNGEDGYSGLHDARPGQWRDDRDAARRHARRGRRDDARRRGLATDYCVKSTVLDARERGYPVTVLGNAIRAVDLQPGDGDRAIEEMFAAGALLESRAAVAPSGG